MISLIHGVLGYRLVLSVAADYYDYDAVVVRSLEVMMMMEWHSIEVAQCVMTMMMMH
jgi:hypothetical protein